MANFTDKYYLDFAGLEEYDRKIKEYLRNSSSELNEALTELIQANADAIAIINGDENTEGSIAKAIITEAAFREAADDALEALITANKEALDILNGDASTEGSVAKQVSDAVAAVVDSAPEMFDTLKEIAEWISDDESGATTLVSRVNELEKADEDLREYIDAQDEKVYKSIQSISFSDIDSLFLTEVEVEEGQTVAEAIANLQEGEKLVLPANELVTENLTIANDAVIEANGTIFSGDVSVAADADVVIKDAKFLNPVTVA